MITQEQQKQGAELMRTLVEKAWESATFKDQLVKNPVATIEAFTKQEIKENVKVVVEDQTNSSVIYLNIPRKVHFESMELSDEQLEMISGGEILGTAGAVIAGAAVVATLFGTGVLIYQVTH